MSCLNKETLTVLVITTAVTYTMEEIEEQKTKEAFAAAEAVTVAETAEITLQSPNHCLKENYKKGAYISSQPLKDCIKLHNSRKYMTFCPSYAQTKFTNSSTVICNNQELVEAQYMAYVGLSGCFKMVKTNTCKINTVDPNSTIDASTGACPVIKVITRGLISLMVTYGKN